MHRLTKAQARRIAVRAQMLDARRPTELLAVVRQSPNERLLVEHIPLAVGAAKELYRAFAQLRP